MKSLFRKEFVIGALVIVAMLLLFFGINFLKGVNIFKAANYYYAVYNNVEGLSVSAPVTLNGYKVGLVRDIKYDFDNPGNVIVELSVDKSLRIPYGSEALIASDILGTATVALNLGLDRENFYEVGDTISGKVSAGMLDAVSQNLMPAVNAILPKVDSLLSNLNTLVANPALHKSVTRLDDITLEIEQTMVSLRGVVTALGPIAGDIKNITSSVDTLTSDLTQVSGSLAAAPVDSLLNDLASTIKNLEQLSESLNNPDGTVGRLTSDPELYENINSTISSLDSLFVDIKRNPKRYINIKLL